MEFDQDFSNITFEIRKNNNLKQDISRQKKSQDFDKRYMRAVMPLLSKIINLKIERGEFNAAEYEGLLDNMNRYIVLTLDDCQLKFDKPVPKLTCDCEGCRQKIRAMKGRMSDAFFYKEGYEFGVKPDRPKQSSIASFLSKGGAGSSYSQFQQTKREYKKQTKESVTSVFKSQISRAKKDQKEEQINFRRNVLQAADLLSEGERLLKDQISQQELLKQELVDIGKYLFQKDPEVKAADSPSFPLSEPKPDGNLKSEENPSIRGDFQDEYDWGTELEKIMPADPLLAPSALSDKVIEKDKKDQDDGLGGDVECPACTFINEPGTTMCVICSSSI